jgi:protein-tyrosine phosphatase
MDEIRPWLFVGSYRDTLSKDYLDLFSIGAMLQFAEEIEQTDIESLYLPIEDDLPTSKKHIRAGVDFIREHKRKGDRVLVACGAGINRSSIFATAALKEEEGLSLIDAYQQVKKYHPEALPNLSVWESFCNYYAEPIPYLEVIRLEIRK